MTAERLYALVKRNHIVNTGSGGKAFTDNYYAYTDYWSGPQIFRTRAEAQAKLDKYPVLKDERVLVIIEVDAGPGHYRVTHNSDMTEGRGGDVLIAKFTHFKDAIEASKGWGVMGVGDGDISFVAAKDDTVFDSIKEWKAYDKTKQAARSEKVRVRDSDGSFHVYRDNLPWLIRHVIIH